MTTRVMLLTSVLPWLIFASETRDSIGAEPTGSPSSVRAAQLLFDAAKAVSEEHGDILTIMSDFVLTIQHPSASPADEEKEIRWRIEKQEQDIRATNDENLKRRLQESIKFIPEGVRKKHSQPQRMRGVYTLRLRPRPEMRKFELANFREESGQWDEGMMGLSKVEAGNSRTGINYEVGLKAASVGNSASTMDRIVTNGRLQEAEVLLLILNKYLSKEGTYDLNEAYGAFVSEGIDFSLGDSVDYGDGHQGETAILTINDARTNRFILYHVVVDEGRGFICPLIRKYGLNGALMQEWIAENYFLDHTSGLWFPQNLTYVTYDPIDESAVKERRLVEVAPEKTRLNIELHDDAFSATLAPGVTMIDTRGPAPIAYKVSTQAVVDFNPSSLNFDGRPEFVEAVSEQGKLPARGPMKGRPAKWPWLLYANIAVVLLFIFMWWRVWRRSRNAR